MKRYRIIVSNQAKQSLRNIVDYIAEDSSTAADHVRKTLIELIGTLLTSPEKYPRESLLESRKGNYRSIVKWHYKIVYLVKSRDVIVLDIIHTSRSPEVIKKLR